MRGKKSLIEIPPATKNHLAPGDINRIILYKQIVTKFTSDSVVINNYNHLNFKYIVCLKSLPDYLALILNQSSKELVTTCFLKHI